MGFFIKKGSFSAKIAVKPATICSTRVRNCSPVKEVGGRRGESKELHRVGAGEPSPSTTTDTNTSFANHLPQIR